MSSLPLFMSQTWYKTELESVREFQLKVYKQVKEYINQGYNLEIEWLNSDGEVCETEPEKSESITCVILPSRTNESKCDYDEICESEEKIAKSAAYIFAASPNYPEYNLVARAMSKSIWKS